MAASRNNHPAITRLKLWLPVLLCLIIIFYFSSLPAKDIPPLFPFQDIIFHTFIYALMAYFFARALKNTYAKLSLLRIICFTVAFGILYGASDEFHQAFVPGRDASAFDLFIDGLGSLLGSLFYR